MRETTLLATVTNININRETPVPVCQGCAQGDEKKHPITVPSLARSVNYHLEGFLASIPLEFIIDTGAPVSRLCISIGRIFGVTITPPIVGI